MKISLHPHFFDILFTEKAEVIQVFKDVLGLYDINHISISQIIKSQQIITLSSTPSLEFNLFKSQFWTFDKTFNSKWFSQEKASSWQNLYDPKYYDELYYLKQLKPNLPIAYSLSMKVDEDYFVYSMASSGEEAKEQFIANLANHSKIGLYCAKHLNPLLLELAERIE